MRLTPAFQIECFRNWNLRPLCHNQATLLLRQGSTSIGSLQCNKLKTFRNNQTSLAVPHNIKLLNRRQNLAVRAEYGDASRGGGGDFLAGFILGGAVFGTLAYVFAPQIRRSLLNEDEYGFRRAKRPIYYDGGLEKTRQTLNAKISQLNSAIDNVSSRLRRGKNMSVPEPDEVDSEIEATM